MKNTNKKYADIATMQEQQNRCYSVAVIMTRCAYTHKFVFGLFWCTKVRVARNCSAFFIAIFQRGFNLVHHRVTRTARARRRSGGQKRPSGAFLERGRVPDGAPESALLQSRALFLC